ncbi:hypothetical protein K7X08_013459 [Anisodus acutangulus]|uniref:VOC domain-containing protein n=1 Tax=Anisodus acutangulus TaxID=402998 RepID=A0A9Q1LKC5_9SOLA|nr:hypothetical protein K7X08_013459 [Anisodus acutangulus]
MKGNTGNPLGLTSLNHISLVCTSIEESIDFYKNVLGFVSVRRPGSFNFNGAWLFGHGIGIHLLQSEDPEKSPKKTEINPKDNHISFQCESIDAVEKKLTEMVIQYVRNLVEEGGIYVDQLFFHDPDGFMVEICNCDKLPVIPLVGEMARVVEEEGKTRNKDKEGDPNPNKNENNFNEHENKKDSDSPGNPESSQQPEQVTENSGQNAENKIQKEKDKRRNKKKKLIRMLRTRNKGSKKKLME